VYGGLSAASSFKNSLFLSPLFSLFAALFFKKKEEEEETEEEVKEEEEETEEK